MGYAREHGIKALCFDIDGTFYPKRQMMVRLALSSVFHLPFALKYNAMRQRLREETGFSEGDTEDFLSFCEKECAILYPDKDVQYFIDKEERVFRRPWERLFSSIKPYPGLRETLEKARDEGFILAALSDFPVANKLAALGIDDLISYRASTEEYGALKPSVRALYTGDSCSKDVDGARNAGMHTALISHSVRVYNNADIIFSSWEEFGKVVL